MDQSPQYRLRAAIATVIAGIVMTSLLGATVLNPSPTQVSAPHALLELPEYSGANQIQGGEFYRPAANLADNLAPGTLLKSEPIAAAPPGITAYRFLYVSQTQSGENNIVSAFFAVRSGPAPGPNGRPLLAVAHGTTGNAPGCGVSEAPFTPASTGYGTWSQIIAGLVGSGYGVVATDYANLGLSATPNYLTMKGEANDVLNSMRAAYRLASDQLDTSKAAILGHSQGGHAALSAAYLAPDYAPELAIKGVAGLAPAIFPPAPLLIKFVQSAPDKDAADFLAFISYAVESWSANYPDKIKVSDVFTPKGVAAAAVGKTKCMDATAKAFAGPKKDFVQANIPTAILGIAQQNFPIYQKYAYPILIQQGLKDTTVVPGINLAFARTACLQGSNVTLQTFPKDVHSSVLYTGQPELLTWLNDRMAGRAPSSNCGGL